MADYKIRIVTEADKAALTAVNKEVAGVTEQTKKLDEQQKKATDSTKGFAKENKSLLDGFKKLGNQVPVLGAALNALKNPYTALAFGLGIVVVKLREFTQAVEESATKAQGLDRFNGLVRTFNTLAAEQRAKKNAFAEQLNEIGASAKSAEERMRSVNEQIERTLRLEGNEDAANKANELARIDAQEQAGSLTPAAAIRARAGVEATFAARATDRESRKAAGIVTATGNARRAALEQAAGLEGALPGLVGAESEAAKRLQAAKLQESNFAAAGVFINGKSVPLAEALRMRNELVQQATTDEPATMASDPLKFMAQQRRAGKIAGLESAITGFQSTLDQQGSVTRQAQSEFDIAAGRVGATRAGIISARGTAATLGSQFTNQAAAFGQELASGGRVAGVEASTASISSNTAANAALMAEAAKQQAEAEKQLREVLRSLGDGLSEIGGLRREVEYLRTQAKGTISSQ